MRCFLDALSYGGQTLLIGMATVFSVLVIIWLALVLFKFFLYDLPSRKTAKPTESIEAPAAPAAPTVSSNDEIVAVIAAAIAIAESESNGVKFKVVSFRRK